MLNKVNDSFLPSKAITLSVKSSPYEKTTGDNFSVSNLFTRGFIETEEEVHVFLVIARLQKTETKRLRGQRSNDLNVVHPSGAGSSST